MHRVLCEKAIECLKQFDEVDRIVLYGSVYRGDYRHDSDIDLAVICDDLWRGFVSGIDGFPIWLRQKIDHSLDALPNPHNIRFHVPIYWNSEWEAGIELSSVQPAALLNDIGSVVFSAYDSNKHL